MKRWLLHFLPTFMGFFAVCRAVDMVKDQLGDRASTIISLCVALVMSILFTFVVIRLKPQ